MYTFEITKIQDILYRQGTSERYAPLGLSFPPLPRRTPPIHEAMGGYAAPKAHAGQSCSDDVFPLTRIPPDCPKSHRETEILRTHIQGRKRILDSH